MYIIYQGSHVSIMEPHCFNIRLPPASVEYYYAILSAINIGIAAVEGGGKGLYQYHFEFPLRFALMQMESFEERLADTDRQGSAGAPSAALPNVIRKVHHSRSSPP